jgi:hypothetical protein
VKFKINNRWIFAEVTAPGKGAKFRKMEKVIAAKEVVELPSSVRTFEFCTKKH